MRQNMVHKTTVLFRVNTTLFCLDGITEAEAFLQLKVEFITVIFTLAKAW